MVWICCLVFLSGVFQVIFLSRVMLKFMGAVGLKCPAASCG